MKNSLVGIQREVNSVKHYSMNVGEKNTGEKEKEHQVLGIKVCDVVKAICAQWAMEAFVQYKKRTIEFDCKLLQTVWRDATLNTTLTLIDL